MLVNWIKYAKCEGWKTQQVHVILNSTNNKIKINFNKIVVKIAWETTGKQKKPHKKFQI